MKAVKFALAVSTLFSTTLAQAAQFPVFDARAAGMGGTGVASANIPAAPFFNPAMLAAQRFDDDFALTAGFGIRAADQQDLLTDIENFNTAVTNSDVAGYAAAATSANGKTLELEANGATTLGIAGDTWSMAVSANGYLLANTGVTFAGLNGIDSTLSFSAVEATEIGFSLARKFGNLSVGVTPKYINATTYEGSALLSNTADISAIIDTATTSGAVDQGQEMNFDAGIVYRLGDSGWQVGAVHRNMMEQTYNTGSQTITLKPQMRAGLAYNGSLLTLAVDYDLTKNDPLSSSGGVETQMLAAGLEFDLGLVELRAGYAMNQAVTSGEDTLSAGVGIYLFGATVDIAAIGTGNNMSVYAQLGVQF